MIGSLWNARAPLLVNLWRKSHIVFPISATVVVHMREGAEPRIPAHTDARFPFSGSCPGLSTHAVLLRTDLVQIHHLVPVCKSSWVNDSHPLANVISCRLKSLCTKLGFILSACKTCSRSSIREACRDVLIPRLLSLRWQSQLWHDNLKCTLTTRWKLAETLVIQVSPTTTCRPPGWLVSEATCVEHVSKTNGQGRRRSQARVQ